MSNAWRTEQIRFGVLFSKVDWISIIHFADWLGIFRIYSADQMAEDILRPIQIIHLLMLFFFEISGRRTGFVRRPRRVGRGVFRVFERVETEEGWWVESICLPVSI
jgi:hypothetical protein